MTETGQHAADKGPALRPVPPDAQSGEDATKRSAHDSGNLSRDLLSELRQETESMLLFALAEGLPLDDGTIDAVGGLERDEPMPVTDLVKLHARLASIIAPAKPRAMKYLRPVTQSTRSRILGISPSMRWVSAAALLFTFCFFAVSLSGEITADNMRQSIYELDGYPLAMHLFLVMSAAGIGSTFAVLFDLWNDINLRRYDPVNESGMWLRIALGLVAGLVLSEIIRSEAVLTAGTETVQVTEGALMSGPLLALAGGFSANILYVVLNSVVRAFRRAFGSDEPVDLPARRVVWPVPQTQAPGAGSPTSTSLPPAPRSDHP